MLGYTPEHNSSSSTTFMTGSSFREETQVGILKAQLDMAKEELDGISDLRPCDADLHPRRDFEPC